MGCAASTKAATPAQYRPVLEREGSGFVTQTQRYTVLTAEKYTGTVTWYVNGEKQSATGTSFMPVFALPGQKAIVARLNTTREQAVATVTIQSYSGIVIESLLPNPIAPDSEEVVIQNTNSFPVTLRDWRLQSQASRALVPISVLIESSASVTIKVRNKLLNHGGAYGLYNEANELVDSVSYGLAPIGERLTRTQTHWRFSSSEVEEIEVTSLGEPKDGIPMGEDPSTAASAFMDSEVHAVMQIPEPNLPFQAWIRFWINCLVLGGYALLSSCWKKSV